MRIYSHLVEADREGYQMDDEETEFLSSANLQVELTREEES